MQLSLYFLKGNLRTSIHRNSKNVHKNAEAQNNNLPSPCEFGTHSTCRSGNLYTCGKPRSKHWAIRAVKLYYNKKWNGIAYYLHNISISEFYHKKK